MKFNDREVIIQGDEKPDMEGILHYKRTNTSDWSSWYSGPSLKERKFKLIHNLLFYYRNGDREPLGVFILENMKVKKEKHSGMFFAFSIEFVDEEQKYFFSCRTQEETDNWVEKLKEASYEYWRTQLIILQKKISMRTGKEPVLSYSGNQGITEYLHWSNKRIGKTKSTFHSHIDDSVGTSSSFYRSNEITPVVNLNQNDNLSKTECVKLNNPFLENNKPNEPNTKKYAQNIEPPIDDLIQF